MTTPARLGLLSIALLVAGTLLVIIAGSGGAGSPIVLAVTLMALGLVPLVLSLRAAGRGRYGSGVAWVWCAIPFEAILILLSLQAIQPFGQCQCEPGSDGPPLPALAALILLLGAVTANLILIRLAVLRQAPIDNA